MRCVFLILMVSLSNHAAKLGQHRIERAAPARNRLAMTGKRQKHGAEARFDLETLRDMAGDKVFARGQAYHDEGRVEIAAMDRTRVAARVIGSEIYRTELKGAGKRFSGACSCPAFSDHGFCKHMVATALAANHVAPDELKKIGSRFARIRDYLRAQGVDALVKRLMALAERDAAVLQDIELAAVAAGDDDASVLARFRGAIADAISTRDYIEYGEVGEWAAGIEVVLDRVEGLVGQGKAALALPLLDEFFDDMEEALGHVDDSNGEIGALVARAAEIHLAACRTTKPDPVELAQNLYDREAGSDWDFFHGASETYADVLGKAGLAEYRRLAEAAWGKIKPLHAGRGGDDEDRYGLRFRLSSILESFAKCDGDVDARIAVRKKDLSSAYDYLGIAELCLAHGRDAEALEWAEEGLWQFEDNPDERLVVFAAELYVRLGRKADAERALWREFERSPSLDLYKQMDAVLDRSRSVRGRAVTFLKARLAQPKSQSLARRASVPDVLLQLLVHEKLFDDAWEVAEKHGVGERERLRLAQASEANHPARAWKVYADQVESLLKSGGQRNYEEACAFIGHIGRLRAGLGEKDSHAAWLDELALRHKAKRNFMELLRR